MVCQSVSVSLLLGLRLPVWDLLPLMTHCSHLGNCAIPAYLSVSCLPPSPGSLLGASRLWRPAAWSHGMSGSPCATTGGCAAFY